MDGLFGGGREPHLHRRERNAGRTAEAGESRSVQAIRVGTARREVDLQRERLGARRLKLYRTDAARDAEPVRIAGFPGNEWVFAYKAACLPVGCGERFR